MCYCMDKMKLVHWLLMGGLLHLVQWGGDSVVCLHVQTPLCCMIITLNVSRAFRFCLICDSAKCGSVIQFRRVALSNFIFFLRYVNVVVWLMVTQRSLATRYQVWRSCTDVGWWMSIVINSVYYVVWWH